MSRLFVVGIGPGDLKHMTFEAREAVASAGVVVGYKTYLDLIKPLLAGKKVVSTGMTKEVERCREALRLAVAGNSVALVSGGDAGVYGMAGLVLELAEEILLNPPFAKGDLKVEIVIVPGVSAVQAAAAVLGAPLMHDFAVISLSDLLTPWEAIEKRLAAAAEADFVTAVYNPRSKGRATHLDRAREILLGRRSPSTPVGIVRNACRSGEEKIVTTLGAMDTSGVDMYSLVIIGNSQTFVDGAGRMVTPRGYETGTRLYKTGTRNEVVQNRNEERGYTKQERGTRNEVFNPRTSNLGPRTSNLEPRTSNLGPRTSNLGPRTSNLEPRPGARPRAVMFCGTASDVGKSVLTAGLCRILKKRGISVAPFKSQNMALNSFVTPEGGEIGRAQAVQAQACGIPPHTDMNPVLLKPNSDTGSQVIVQGRAVGNMDVGEYTAYKPIAFAKVRESFARLSSRHDFIAMEGAGSIAEINLKSHDIANLKVAEMADCPAILIADIDRGGVFAQIVGTIELLEPRERERIRGIIINKFRGDPALLGSAIEFVEGRTGIPVLGVVPYFSGFRIPDEDSVALQKKAKGKGQRAKGKDIRIGVVRLPRISNFTDFEALEGEGDVDLRYIEEPGALAGLDALIIPGSKSTISDLCFLKEKGLFQAIQRFRGVIAGICGGFQMLGRRVHDPFNLESPILQADGLGLLDAETTMLEKKQTHQARARLMAGGEMVAPGCADELSGYEIHMGETVIGPRSRPFATVLVRSGKGAEIPDGAVSADGRVFGTYLHGVFDNAGFRNAFLNRLRKGKGLSEVTAPPPQADPFDLLAAHLERHLDMERLLAICGIEADGGPEVL